MTAYKKFNFVFFTWLNPLYTTILYDASYLNNFRAMRPTFGDKPFQSQPFFTPYIYPNNPSAFRNAADYSTWSEDFFSRDFPVKNPLCFVVYEGFYPIFKPMKFLPYLRACYPNCKLVLWIENPMHVLKKVRGMFVDKADTQEILSTFDCIFTYNQIDAIDYGLTYFEGPYSVLPVEQTKETVDIFYAGAAKNRLEKILRAYEVFTESGFVCEFFVCEKNPPPIPHVNLHFTQYLPYHEIIKRIVHSRAILDITQENTYGLTMRYFESLAYNKIFITDNAFYRQKRFDSPKIFLIDKSYELDREKFTAASKLPNNYRNEYSPLHLISFLESELNS